MTTAAPTSQPLWKVGGDPRAESEFAIRWHALDMARKFFHPHSDDYTITQADIISMAKVFEAYLRGADVTPDETRDMTS